MTLYILLYALFHIACGVLSFGIGFAACQRSYPLTAEERYGTQRRQELQAALCGPIALVATFIVYGTRHGLKFK